MRLALTITAALVAAAAPAQKTEQVARDWSAVAAQNAAGAYVIGDPAARVKVVEWASYTCPHCADFSVRSEPVLKDRMIRSGSTSLEIRHLIRDPFDLAAALLVRCAGPRGFGQAHAAVFAAQPQWLARAAAFQRSDGARMAKLPQARRIAAAADGSGLTALMRARGLPAAAAAKCLGDEAAMKRLVQASSPPPEVTGTPSFFVNGRHAPVHDWAGLEPVLRAAGAR